MIEKYISFGIENGYIIKIGDSEYEGFEFSIDGFQGGYDIIVWRDGEIYNEADLIRIITSKEFIEAVASGLIDCKYEIIYGYDEGAMVYLGSMEGKIEYITLNQAIAIRDNILDEFITNLLK